jgi:hypothetical protein
MVEEGSQYIKLPQFQIQPDISELPRVLEGILQSCADTLGGTKNMFYVRKWLIYDFIDFAFQAYPGFL